jgi:glyoxylase-like metal-dependent hydrolase (beta-lactamase superfamily II)
VSTVSGAWARVERHESGVVWIQEPLVRSGLVEGERDIAVIDTGMGVVDFRAVVEGHSQRAPLVLQTHTHWDHIGGSHLFDRVLVHPEEVDSLRQGLSHERFVKSMERFSSQLPMPESWDPDTAVIPGVEAAGLLHDGDIIDLGGRVLEVIHTPGHSPGGVSFLDRAGRALFVGDAINMATMLLCLPGSDPNAFLQTVRRLATRVSEVDVIVPGHGNLMTAEDVRRVHAAFEEVYAGRPPTRREEIDMGMPELLPVEVHTFDGFEFLITPDVLAPAARS